MFNYEILKSLNDMEMLVYDYLMKNKEKVTYMTVRELADEVHVSTATVMRFCRKAGFDGYSEFKVKFKMFLNEEKKWKHQVNEDIQDSGIFSEDKFRNSPQKELDEIADVVRDESRLFYWT